MSRLELVKEEVVGEAAAPVTSAEAQVAMAAAQQQQNIATEMMMQALKALSQRFVVALSNLFTLLTAASAFYLWLTALPTLDTVKIVGLTIYSGFVLALNVYGRRK